jgi:hypothetical protein
MRLHRHRQNLMNILLAAMRTKILRPIKTLKTNTAHHLLGFKRRLLSLPDNLLITLDTITIRPDPLTPDARIIAAVHAYPGVFSDFRAAVNTIRHSISS